MTDKEIKEIILECFFNLTVNGLSILKKEFLAMEMKPEDSIKFCTIDPSSFPYGYIGEDVYVSDMYETHLWKDIRSYIKREFV